MNTVKQWYALYTRPRWEKKVAENLAKKGIEAYCPLNRTLKQWADRKKVVFEPLFTSYVFVRLSEQELKSARQVDGVVNFVYWLSKPAVIKDVEIDMIKRFLNEHTNIQLEKTRVNINDMVRIISGPLMEKEGSVLEVRNNTVKVYLPSLGYQLVAEVEKSNIVLVTDPASMNAYAFVQQ